MDPQQIVELGKLLKNNGDKILNSEFALILSGSILRALNDSFTLIVDSLECGDAKNFQVLKTINSKSSTFRDLQLISDSVQKTPQLCMNMISLHTLNASNPKIVANGKFSKIPINVTSFTSDNYYSQNGPVIINNTSHLVTVSHFQTPEPGIIGSPMQKCVEKNATTHLINLIISKAFSEGVLTSAVTALTFAFIFQSDYLEYENGLDTYDDIERLGEFRSNLEVERCEITIRNVIENALDRERNQILELLEIVATKLAAPIRRFLAEGAEVLHEASNSMERLMMYLENSLRTLYNTLNEVNFARILDAIWAELSVNSYDLIQSNLDKGRPPAFFQNLRQTLYVMNSCFKTGNMVTSDIEVLTEVEGILDLHAFETVDLIHQYYLERLDHQKEINKSEYGQLTRRTNFIETDLKLDI
uniref:MHD2 domain-containing protein n=1 Tax=Glossina palpalis gambiensis TaxID=67801 RepID=A0A1B0BLC4_9MUSC